MTKDCIICCPDENPVVTAEQENIERLENKIDTCLMALDTVEKTVSLWRSRALEAEELLCAPLLKDELSPSLLETAKLLKNSSSIAKALLAVLAENSSDQRELAQHNQDRVNVLERSLEISERDEHATSVRLNRAKEKAGDKLHEAVLTYLDLQLEEHTCGDSQVVAESCTACGSLTKLHESAYVYEKAAESCLLETNKHA